MFYLAIDLCILFKKDRNVRIKNLDKKDRDLKFDPSVKHDHRSRFDR